MTAKPVSPLPWRRESYSGSTDSWIDDADGQDICRVSGPEPHRHTVAIRDKDAEAIVVAVNGMAPAAEVCAEPAVVEAIQRYVAADKMTVKAARFKDELVRVVCSAQLHPVSEVRAKARAEALREAGEVAEGWFKGEDHIVVRGIRALAKKDS